jgi:hypothetical protein
MTWPDACEKFRRYTKPFIAEVRAHAIMEAIAALPDVPHVEALTQRIATAL